MPVSATSLEWGKIPFADLSATVGLTPPRSWIIKSDAVDLTIFWTSISSVKTWPLAMAPRQLICILCNHSGRHHQLFTLRETTKPMLKKLCSKIVAFGASPVFQIHGISYFMNLWCISQVVNIEIKNSVRNQSNPSAFLYVALLMQLMQ